MGTFTNLSIAASLAWLAGVSAVHSQGWRWGEGGYVERSGPSDNRGRWDQRQLDRGQWGRYRGGPWAWDEPPSRPNGPVDSSTGLSKEVRDGGERPDIAPAAPPIVAFQYDYAANSIVIDSHQKRLYFVLPGNRAYAYQISVGREGFNWFGTETVSRKQAWPDWHPPAEMRQRDTSLPEKMTGGLKNPLGAMALYLGTTLYRIHGTNDERSLGQAQSSGCFRMLNANVLHLASLADVGTTVHVVEKLTSQRVSTMDRASPPPSKTSPPSRAQATSPTMSPAPSWQRPYDRSAYDRERYLWPEPRPVPYGWR